jgi:hypothetical protein
MITLFKPNSIYYSLNIISYKNFIQIIYLSEIEMATTDTSQTQTLFQFIILILAFKSKKQITNCLENK